jgi:TonB family protein
MPKSIGFWSYPMTMQIFRAAHIPLFLLLTLGFLRFQMANEWSGFYPESYARKAAINTAMPIYPLDAVQRGITGVVQVKIAIDDQGKVAKIRIHPAIDPSLKSAIADAVDKWTFRLRPELVVPGRNSLTRLTFQFSIKGDEPRVEFYQPGPGAKDSEHLGYWDGYRELRDWKKWEEIQPTKNQN